MGKIVAIGGGEIKRGQTLSIDREIVALTGRRRPRALFVPTASGDASAYWETFQRVYGQKLGCQCDVLFLLSERPSARALRQRIRQANLIYVGGGNTLKMMRRWRFLGVDDELRKAWRRGTVLCGVSAGAICWFDNGHSDSLRGYAHKDWKYIRVSGMGLIKGTCCPHYNHDDRQGDLEDMIGRLGGCGIALDDGCALEVVDDRYRVLASIRGANAHAVARHRGRIVTRLIPRKKQFRPLTELYAQ